MNAGMEWRLLPLLCCLAWPVLAEDRALLVGVGDYPQAGARLPGIGQDLAMMREVARRLGFEPDNIRALHNGEAALADVERAIDSWLIQGTRPGDWILIYFSGHGSRVPDLDGDETQDQADEVLLMHDARLSQGSGGPHLEGVLLDDRFGEWLHQLAGRNVLVIVDACHSGSATKALPGPFAGAPHPAKLFRYAGMPLGRVEAQSMVESPDIGNAALLAAAGDDEESLPGEQGSLFTRLIHQAVRQAAEESRDLSLEQLRDAARQGIQAELPRGQWFTPVLSGNPRLTRARFRLGQ